MFEGGSLEIWNKIYCDDLICNKENGFLINSKIKNYF